LRDLPGPAFAVAAKLEKAGLDGIQDIVASYDTVGVYGVCHVADLEAAATSPVAAVEESVTHVIPVCYEMGEDLKEVADFLRMPPEEVVRWHGSVAYRCFALGFCPGFPYLGYLPEAIQGVPRRAAPRVRIEPGSVAITGAQTAIYPLERPGGWALLGRTPLKIADEAARHFPVAPGDLVRFVPIDAREYRERRGELLRR